MLKMFTWSSVFLQLHDYKAGTPAEKTYFIELWDIGGSSAHKNSRGIFYDPGHGDKEHGLYPWYHTVFGAASCVDPTV